MKSKFYLAFILAGIVPVVGLAGFYLYTALNNETPAASSGPAAVAVNPAQEQSEVQTIASSIFSAIKSTNADAAGLSAHHAPAELDNFVHSHPGVSGVVLLDSTGKAVRTMPSNPTLVDANYGSTPEFTKVQEKLKENGGNNYQFYTSRLGYPSFVFAVPLPSGYLAEVVLNITQFFRGASSNGFYFIVDANSGHYLYHSDASQLSGEFNSQHESWLNQVQTDLMDQKNGVAMGPSMGAAYGYLGFGKFGVVHQFNLTVPGMAGSKASVKNDVSESVMTPMALGFIIAMSLLCIGAAIASRMLANPFRRATGVILAAADDPGTLTPEVVKSFGNDEAGQIIQALNLLNEKYQEKKEAVVRNLNDQVSGLQRQSRQYQTEAQEKTQLMGDKLKELDALKGMSEGLRNQSEQAKNDNARLKSELTAAQAVQVEFTALQNRMAQVQTQLKNAEAKAAQASTIQVSQVRAAAIRTMAEELKNTLGIIKGYVSSVIGAGQGGINEKQQEFLGMVINRSARLEKFINDLVDMYQVEIEQKDAKTEEVDLPREIETLAFNFQTQTELKNLKFKVEAKPGLPKVPVVRRRLTQLWNVLYLQLIKDAPKGTTIPIVVEAAGDTVRVNLHDPGLIVTAEGLPKMFDEFYDPKHPSSPQLAGTGLKLSLVKTILNSQGGSARAEKAEPGTRIVLTFATKKPLDATAAPVMASASPVPAATTPKPVLSPAPGLTPGAKPALDLNSAFGLKPAAPAAAAPGITVGAKPPLSVTPASPAPAVPPAGTPAAPPKAPGGVLDSLLSGKIPSVTAPGLKPASAPPAAPPSPTPTAPVPGITIGAKPPAGTPGAPPPPPSGITIGARPPAGASGGAPPPPSGISVGSKIPGMEGPAGAVAPLPPIAGLTVGAKPPSAGTAAPGVPPAPKPPVSMTPAPGTPPVPAAGKLPQPSVPGAPPTPGAGTPKPPGVSLDALLNKPASGAPLNIQKPTLPPSVPKPSGDDLLE